MVNITKEQIQELFEIQKSFDARMTSLNLKDSKTAYAVEFFEWFNTIESFKNWKKRPGKPLEQQLDELADVLAFALSIKNQIGEVNQLTFDKIINCDSGLHIDVEQYSYDELFAIIDNAIVLNETVVLVMAIAHKYYTIDMLIKAYKNKMRVNHARQDGTADKDKGYV